MHFHPADISRLLRLAPVASLMHENRALAFLTGKVLDALELAPVLARYPAVRYEPLDFHYICLQSLGALNAELLEDLLVTQGYAGVIWGSLLAALAPAREYAPLLRRVQAHPRNQWAVELALEAIDGVQSARLEDLHWVVQSLRSALRGLPRPDVQLRPASTALQNASQVRDAYRTGGADAALKVLRAGGAA